MNVGELIEALQGYDPSDHVIILEITADDQYGYSFDVEPGIKYDRGTHDTVVLSHYTD